VANNLNENKGKKGAATGTKERTTNTLKKPNCHHPVDSSKIDTDSAQNEPNLQRSRSLAFG